MEKFYSSLPAVGNRKKKNRFAIEFSRHAFLYLMILPGLIYFLIFKYGPMFGLIIAFENYSPYKGVFGSEMVGFAHFIRFFSAPQFMILLRNTLAIFGLNLVFAFPIPIILALMLNEMRSRSLKKGIQTVIYLPHFMSWVIVVSIFYTLLTTEGGVITQMLVNMGFENAAPLQDEAWLRPMYIIQNIWKGSGWGSIIYLAALTAVDEQLYEAAEIDGAGRFKQMWHITLPCIRPTIVIMLILKVGEILDLGFEHMFLLLNSANRNVADIFDTFVYIEGVKNSQFSYSAAAGMFKSLVGLLVVIVVNKIAKKLGEEGVY
ncbi:MAG: ABC transporter permease subunit [Eubacterium sp.]|nr:ABC transporter permease subunit [Eubacterium sp.]